MKKSLYFIVFICILCLCSCGIQPITQKDEGMYNSFIIDYANDGIVTKNEKSLWSDGYTTNTTAEKAKNVFFEGINYKAEYHKSSLGATRYTKHDIYYDSETGADIYFSDGRFAGIHFGRLLIGDYDYKANIVDEQKALEMAKSIVQKYIDINEYKIDISTSNVNANNLDLPETYLYSVSFYKEIGGFKTSDEAICIITSKGDIRTLHLFDIGLFEHIKVPIVDASKLRESIVAKVDKIYEKYPEHEIISIENKSISLSPEKDVVIVSNIKIKLDDLTRTAVVLATYVN